MLTFYGVIAFALIAAGRAWQRSNKVDKVVVWSFAAATVGILLNAILIDVFAASKVAFSFWLLVGMFYATLALENQSVSQQLGCRLGSSLKLAEATNHLNKKSKSKKKVEVADV